MKLQNVIHILIGIVCIRFLPGAQAVVPPPDGGYPNFTTAEGTNALQSLTTGAANTAVGWHSLFSNADGNFNTATGAGALLFNTADENTAFGAAALLFNTSGLSNTAVGAAALLNNTGGPVDTPNGGLGSQNTAVGFSALSSNTTGTTNTAVGAYALANSTTGFGNIAVGANAGIGVTNANSVIAIGTSGEDVSNSCYIGNIFGVTSAGATAVYINSLGKLGTVVSSRRFKDEIQPMDKASEAILALKPVTFRYKQEIDPVRGPQFGLVAEDVEKVDPDLVVRDAEGKVNTVRYDAVNAMLLNEFLKEHRKNEEQRATIGRLETTVAKQERGLQAVTARLEEQAAQIQKVRAQLETSKPAPQVVNNP